MAALPTMGWRSLRCVISALHLSQAREGALGLSGEAFATVAAMGSALLDGRNNYHGNAPHVGHVP
jgi:hypothetical protein